jgi:hypothetical protein
MAQHDVVARDRQVHRARHQVDIDPCVDAETRRVRAFEHGGKRIERQRLALQLAGARFERARVVGVAAAAHLDEQRVESVRVRRRDEVVDRLRRRQRRAQHPQRANLRPFLAGSVGGRAWDEEKNAEDDCEDGKRGHPPGAGSSRSHKPRKSNRLEAPLSTKDRRAHGSAIAGPPCTTLYRRFVLRVPRSCTVQSGHLIST